ncbi:hypothetical protein J4474_02510 [Candidatus Pacearchaeota archaeon]|nr:hypothetical protein [Candidatus Pacearchaeota archaeon]
MKFGLKELIIAGSLGLALTGCFEQKPVSPNSTGSSLELEKPAECEIIKDIRHYSGWSGGRDMNFQVLCEDKLGKLSLYHKRYLNQSWIKISVK